MCVRAHRVTLRWFAFPRPRGYRQINRRVIEFASERVTTGAPPHTSSVTRGTACRLINRARRRDASRKKRSAYASGARSPSPSARGEAKSRARLSRELYNTRMLQRGCRDSNPILNEYLGNACSSARVSLRPIFHRYIEPHIKESITMHVCMHDT